MFRHIQYNFSYLIEEKYGVLPLYSRANPYFIYIYCFVEQVLSYSLPYFLYKRVLYTYMYSQFFKKQSEGKDEVYVLLYFIYSSQFYLDIKVQMSTPHKMSFSDAKSEENIDWKVLAETLVNEDPSLTDQRVHELKELLKTEPNLKIPDEREFYVKFLRAGLNDPKNSFEIIKNFFTLRAKGNYFEVEKVS